MTLGAFAETASDAWSHPANALGRARSMARSVAFTAAACVWSDDPDIVRCLYGHAVFPEHRATFREFLRDLKSSGDVVTTRTLFETIRYPEAKIRPRSPSPKCRKEPRCACGVHHRVGVRTRRHNASRSGIPQFEKGLATKILRSVAERTRGLHPCRPRLSHKWRRPRESTSSKIGARIRRIASLLTPYNKMKEGHAVVLAPSLRSCSERTGLVSAARRGSCHEPFQRVRWRVFAAALPASFTQSAVHRNVPAAESCRKGTQGRAAGLRQKACLARGTPWQPQGVF
jgi:hypothetical protein